LCEVINSEYKVAVKVIDIKDASKNNVSIKDIETEIEVLKELDSPYVMKYIDCEIRDNK
jgi:predicted RNA-binding protein with RPS1 domain